MQQKRTDSVELKKINKTSVTSQLCVCPPHVSSALHVGPHHSDLRCHLPHAPLQVCVPNPRCWYLRPRSGVLFPPVFILWLVEPIFGL